MRCKDWFVDILLGTEEESRAYREAIEHVEHCGDCQRKLVDLGKEDSTVAELCDTLRTSGELTVDPSHQSSVVISIESLMADDNPIDCEPVSLGFLAAPSHPEMLGRIGRYEVERLIGVGGMGIVLKGFDSELHRVVAIKVLMPHLANSAAARRRFAREAQAAAAVVHEHVIPIFNVESEGDLPYLVMQYVPGKSLQARVDEGGPLEIKDVLRIARQAAAGLAAAHAQGLVHRDVKPANMLLEESVDRVLISDFGLARAVDDAGFTRTGTVAGTPHYMSPEQASGDPVDHRSDLFSLGSSIYFMCTGRPPFRSESAMAVLNRICHEAHRPLDEVNSDVPSQLVDLVDKLLSKDPERRFAHAAFVEDRLAAMLAEIQTGRQLRRRRLRRWLKRSSLMKRVAIGATFAVAFVLLGVALSQFGREQPHPFKSVATPEPEAIEHDVEGSHDFSIAQTEPTTDRAPVDSEPSRADSAKPTDRLEGPSDSEFFEEWRHVIHLLHMIETKSLTSSDGPPNADLNWQHEVESVNALLLQAEGPPAPNPSLSAPVATPTPVY